MPAPHAPHAAGAAPLASPHAIQPAPHGGSHPVAAHPAHDRADRTYYRLTHRDRYMLWGFGAFVVGVVLLLVLAAAIIPNL